MLRSQFAAALPDQISENNNAKELWGGGKIPSEVRAEGAPYHHSGIDTAQLPEKESAASVPVPGREPASAVAFSSSSTGGKSDNNGDSGVLSGSASREKSVSSTEKDECYFATPRTSNLETKPRNKHTKVSEECSGDLMR